MATEHLYGFDKEQVVSILYDFRGEKNVLFVVVPLGLHWGFCPEDNKACWLLDTYDPTCRMKRTFVLSKIFWR